MSAPYDLVVLGGGIVGIWTALRAAEAGCRVAVVEVGPAQLPAQGPSAPEISFPERPNIGAVRARNQVLSGNSSYWGGGLIRNPRSILSELYGEAAQAVASQYPAVETALGVVPEESRSVGVSWNGRPLAEIVVLADRRRRLWSGFLDSGPVRSGQVVVHDRARIQGLERGTDGRLETVALQSADGTAPSVRGKGFCLSMGVIDSIHFVQRFFSESGPGGDGTEAGRRLHDHWSVPVARVRWKNRSGLRHMFPPKFGRGGIIGRRLPDAAGFFHVTANFDEMPPYDRVKAVRAAIQKGESLPKLLGAGLSAMARTWLMARAGLHYCRHRELLVADGAWVNLVLDFESTADPANRLVPRGNHLELYWGIRPGDVSRFAAILRNHRPWFEAALGAEGLQWEWTVGDWSEAGMARHLEAHAVDAYHLGGGLQPVPGGVTDPSGYLRACRNLFINGTAFFARPGTANPVLTLLARANQYVETLRG